VLTDNRELITQARCSLKENWGIAALGTLIYSVLYLIANYTPYISFVLPFIFNGVLILGYAVFVMSVVRRQEIKLELLFSGFSRFGTVFLTYLLILIIVLLWAIPSLILAVFFWFSIYSYIHYSISLSFGRLLTTVAELLVLCAALIPPLVAIYRYSLVYFLIADNPDISAMETLKLSKTIMRGNIRKRIYLDCRFAGWALLGILSLFIGFLWIGPYWQAAGIRFYEDVKKDYDKKISPEHTNSGEVSVVTDFTD